MAARRNISAVQYVIYKRITFVFTSTGTFGPVSAITFVVIARDRLSQNVVAIA